VRPPADTLVQGAALAATLLNSHSPDELLPRLKSLATLRDLDCDRTLVRSIKLLIDDLVEEATEEPELDRAAHVNTAVAVTWPKTEAAELIRLRRLSDAIFSGGETLPLEMAFIATRVEEYRKMEFVRLDALKLAVALSAKASSIFELEDLGDALQASLLYPR